MRKMWSLIDYCPLKKLFISETLKKLLHSHVKMVIFWIQFINKENQLPEFQFKKHLEDRKKKTKLTLHVKFNLYKLIHLTNKKSEYMCDYFDKLEIFEDPFYPNACEKLRRRLSLNIVN